MNRDFNIPDPYHPNQVDLHLEGVQQQALEQLGLSEQVNRQGIESLSPEQAAQVGQVMAEGFEALASNVNQQSE